MFDFKYPINDGFNFAVHCSGKVIPNTQCFVGDWYCHMVPTLRYFGNREGCNSCNPTVRAKGFATFACFKEAPV